MRTLWKILLAGLVVFMALAIGQQWSYFSSVWFGSQPEDSVEPAVDEAAAVEAVRHILVLIEHYYGTGGDPRFAERIPVSSQVLAELQADVEYLRRNRRRQEPHLQRMDVVDVSVVSAERVEVQTREFWIHRIYWLDESGEEAEPPHSQVINSTYSLRLLTGDWHLERWEMGDGRPPFSNEPAQ